MTTDSSAVAVNELLGGKENDLPTLGRGMADSMQEVGLTEAGCAEEDKRVVPAVTGGDPASGTVGKAVTLDDCE